MQYKQATRHPNTLKEKRKIDKKEKTKGGAIHGK